MALRTPLSVTPHLYMGDSTGRPLDNGVVYFGEQDKDPEFYPINLFSDDALTKPLAQPVHTKGGYLYDKGDMVEPHAKELIYSVKVLDSYGRKVFYKGAMMRNSWNDDVIEQINAAIVASTELARQVATDITNEAINNTAVEGGVLADTLVVVDGSLSQRTINKGLESIAGLSTIKNPKDGLRVYVKSYHAGLGKGGGYFVYDSSRSEVDNKGTIINGWIREFTGSVTPLLFGAKGDGSAGDQQCISKAYEYLNSIGGGTLFIPDGLYLIDTVNYVKEAETGASLNEQYAFPIYSNITVAGQSRAKTIFKMADGIIYKKLDEANIGCALFADAHRRVHIENFKLTNFKVDMNGINNPVINLPTEGGGGSWETAQQAIFPVLYFFDYYTSYNIEVDGIWVHQNSGLNSIYVGHKSTYTTIKNCLFTDHSDYIIGNEAIKDHSTLYVAGLNSKIHDNVFLMNHNPVSNVEPTRFSVVSTAIEAHGVNTIVSNNIVDGYGAPFLAASTEWYNGDNILFTGNVAVDAQIGFAFNSMKGQLRASFVGNKVTLRKQKASNADDHLRYAHAAVESMGAINSIFDYSSAYSEIYVTDNVFEQDEATDWGDSDKYINICMNIKEAKTFVAKGNTFIGFKGAVYTALAHRNWLNATHTLTDNTYINCGQDISYTPYRGAYVLSDGVFAQEKEFDFNLLDKITISNDTFINCKYGVLLAKLNDLTAKNIDITGIKYLSGFIPSALFLKPIDIVKGHLVNIEYETTGVVEAGQTLSDNYGVSGKVKLNKWSTNVDDNLLSEIVYVKTPYYDWNLRANGKVPQADVKVGAFANKSGDKVDLVAPVQNGFSKYIYYNGSWYGVGKMDAANKVI